jgi:hypothetical protein
VATRRAVSRSPAWVALDVGVALLSAWIAVGTATPPRASHPGPIAVRLAAALWLLSIGLRRFGPATCLWVAGGATVLAAAAGSPLTNLSLATALAVAFVFRTRPPAAAAVLAVVPTGAALTALLTDQDGRSTWALAALVHVAAALWAQAPDARLAAGPGSSSSTASAPWPPSVPDWRWTCTTPWGTP